MSLARTRIAVRLIAVAALAALTAGCFQPMYAERNDGKPGLREKLMGVEIPPVDKPNVVMIMTDDQSMACSPDRIQTDKLIGLEIKCPSAPVHAQYMREGPGKAYRWQVYGSLLISQFEAWCFESYHPNLREVIIRYDRTPEAEKEIAKLDTALTQFRAEVDEIEAFLRREGFVDPMVALPKRAEDEWRKMLEADPGMWSIA